MVQVVDLGTGRVRWRQPAAVPPGPLGPAAIGGTVVTGAGGRLTGYDDRSGQARWTLSGMPADPVLQGLAGLVLVTSGEQGGPGDPTALTAVSPSTGQVAWRFDPGTAVTALGAGPEDDRVLPYSGVTSSPKALGRLSLPDEPGSGGTHHGPFGNKRPATVLSLRARRAWDGT